MDIDSVTCVICDIQFSSQKEHDEHFNIHVEEEIQEEGHFECQKCNKDFSSYNQYNVHLWGHLGLFSCGICNERFRDMEDLKGHEESQHSANNNTSKSINSKPELFKCNFCDRKFLKLQYLVKHEKMHLNSKECKICNKKFQNLAKLQNHEKSHVNLELTCKICKKGYKTVFGFKKHQLLHGVNIKESFMEE